MKTHEDIPRDIAESRSMLEKFEKAVISNQVDSIIIGKFCEAINNLDEHIDKCNNCQHQTLIKNIKIAYTRSFIEHLDNITPKIVKARYIEGPPVIPIEFLIKLTLNYLLKNEMEQVFEECPYLREKYVNFIELYFRGKK